MTLRRQCVIVATILAAVLVAALTPVQGQEAAPGGLTPGNIHVGPLRVHPSFVEQFDYTSNFFLVTEKKESEFRLIQSPGLLFILPRGRHTFQANYRSDFIVHSEFGRYDRVDNFADGRADLRFPGGLDVKLHLNYAESAVAPFFITDRNKHYTDLKYGLDASYELSDRVTPRVTVEAQVLSFVDPRDEAGTFNSTRVGGGFDAKITPRITGVFDVLRETVDERGNFRDAQRTSYLLGFRLRPGRRLTGTVLGGYDLIVFDEPRLLFRPGAGPPGRLGNRTQGTWTARVTLMYRLGARNTLRADLTRNLVQTSAVSREATDGDILFATLGKGSYEHRFGPKLSLIGFVAIGRNDFRNGAFRPNRRDDVLSVGFTASYRIARFLLADLTYAFRERDARRDRFVAPNPFGVLRVTGFRVNDFNEGRLTIKFTLAL